MNVEVRKGETKDEWEGWLSWKEGKGESRGRSE